MPRFRISRDRVFTTEAQRARRKHGENLSCSTPCFLRFLRASVVNRYLLAALLAAAALAQTASEKPSVDVRRVGSRLACKCGCKDSVASCSMLECEFSKPAKLRIAQMQAVGYSDQQIIQAFVRDYGADIYLAEPNAWGWIVPYLSVGAGLVIVWLFIRKYRKPRPIPELGPIQLDDPALEKYKEQIEKDLANLE